MTATRLQIYDGNLDINKSAPNEGLVDIYDGVIDQYGVIRRRPALSPKQTFTANRGIKGVYYWREKALYVYIINGYVYQSTSITTTPTIVTGSPQLSNGFAHFATQGSWLFIASSGGGNPVLWDGGSTIELVNTNDPIAPGSVIGVTSLDGYILAAESGTKRVWFTKTPDADETVRPEFDQYFSAIGTPGYLQNIKTINREVYVVKSDGVEIWYDDGIAPFRRYEGATIPLGCKAPNSVVVIDGALWFFGENNQVIRINGRSPEVVSVKIDSELRKLVSTADAKFFQLDIYVVAYFPTENKTFVYDLISKNWYQWGRWNTNTLVYDAFLGIDAALNPQTNVWAVPTRIEGSSEYITQFARGLTKDVGFFVRFMIRTAFLDHGTYATKRSNKLSIKVVADQTIKASPDMPPAVRCVAYSYTFTDPAFTIDSITGLPAGITFSYASQTVSGTTLLYGTFEVTLNVNYSGLVQQVVKQFQVSENTDWSIYA